MAKAHDVISTDKLGRFSSIESHDLVTQHLQKKCSGSFFHINSSLFFFSFFLFKFFLTSFFQILEEFMYLTTNYLDMEEKLASAQVGIKNLSIENASLKESVAKSIEMGKQLKTA